MLTLQTTRLDLVACTQQVARAAGGGKRQLESLIGVPVAQAWLEEEGRNLLSYYAHWLSADASGAGWGLWLIIPREKRVMIGTAGFKGQPDYAGKIEIGYGIDAEYRRQGYTSEAAQALINWAFNNDQVNIITAECLTNNIGSMRVLEKLGMTRLNITGAYLNWRLERPQADA